MHSLRECPKTYITQFSHDIIQLYMWSVSFNNALPDSGGLNNQNAVVMEALSIVRDEMGKVEAWRRHEDKLKSEIEASKRKAAAKNRR